MQPLQGHRILLGITGGIAAYKSAWLARRLIEAGGDVRTVMTAGAQAFITPMTLQALTGNPVHTELLDADAEAAMGHIELARWADTILIAPASANTLARLSHGLADDLLGTVCLASAAQLLLAPAMNQQMWAHPATSANCRLLVSRGAVLLGPDEGLQACGDTGAGRMLEPEEIRDRLIRHLETTRQSVPALPATLTRALDPARTASPAANQPLSRHGSGASLDGLRIVITAGPTREPIDPVRYISNHSSGKMGFALAAVAAERGAQVTLVAGPVSLETPPGVQRQDVDSAREMQAAVMTLIEATDVFISVAAVADYRVADVAAQKIKKNDDSMALQLVRNPDILASVANHAERPFCVGFAAETEHIETHARAKLERKKLDLIAANHVGQPDNPVFGSDTNELDVYWGDAGHHAIAAGSKVDVAGDLLDVVAGQLAARADVPTSV